MGYSEALRNIGTAYDANAVYKMGSDKETGKEPLSFDSVFREQAVSALNSDSDIILTNSGTDINKAMNDLYFSDGNGISEMDDDLDDSIGPDELEELDRTAEETAAQKRARAVAFPVVSAEDELSELLFSEDEISDSFEGLM